MYNVHVLYVQWNVHVVRTVRVLCTLYMYMLYAHYMYTMVILITHHYYITHHHISVNDHVVLLVLMTNKRRLPPVEYQPTGLAAYKAV